MAVVTTYEPGGSRLGERIRELLLNKEHKGMNAHAELLLFFAARAEHVEKTIRPALEAGRWVLCERFTDATYAYQAGGRGMDKQFIDYLARHTIGGLEPDLTILLSVKSRKDAPRNVGAERISRSSQLALNVGKAKGGAQPKERAAPDRFEQESGDFFRRVEAAYHAMANADKKRWKVVDGKKPYAEVQERINSLLQPLTRA